MERKILLAVLVLAIVLIFASFALVLVSQGRASGEKYCETDNDCACGVRINSGECFYGNRNFVDAIRQCPDFCNGIAANLEIRCMSNKCSQVSVSD
jgi:hypothetical protein